MKRVKEKRLATLAVLIVAAAAIFFVPQNVAPSYADPEIVQSGTVGTCVWTLDSDGLLTIQPPEGSSTGMLPETIYPNPDYTGWPWSDYSEDIKSVKIKKTVKAFICKNMFRGCIYLDKVDLSGLNTTGVKNMSRMFCHCQRMQSDPDLSHFDTSSVTDMSYMFEAALPYDTKLDLSSWDVSKVTTMECMFNDCHAKELIISNWDVSSVQNMDRMFSGAAPEHLDLSGWSTNSVTTMQTIFISMHRTKMIIIPETFDLSKIRSFKPLVPYRLFEIAHDPDDPFKYTNQIPDGRFDLVTEPGKPAVYVVGGYIWFVNPDKEGPYESQLYCYSVPAKPLRSIEDIGYTKEGYTFDKWKYYDGRDDEWRYLEDQEAIDWDLIYHADYYGELHVKYVNLYPVWKKNASYTVQYYYENKGAYPDKPDDTKTVESTEGTEVSVTDEEKKPARKGYVFDEGADNVLSGTVAEDGSLALKVYFKKQYKITFDPNGGTIDGSADPVSSTHSYGDVIQILDAPVWDGHTFLYWKGSKYDPGQEYKVTEDHTFTAQWDNDTTDETTDKTTEKTAEKTTAPGGTKKSDSSSSSGGGGDNGTTASSSGGGGSDSGGSGNSKENGNKSHEAGTGDESPLAVWIMLFGLAATGVSATLIARRRSRS